MWLLVASKYVENLSGGGTATWTKYRYIRDEDVKRFVCDDLNHTDKIIRIELEGETIEDVGNVSKAPWYD